MAVSVFVYNHTLRLFLTNQVDLATLKVELLSDSATFVSTHATKAQVDNTGAYEVSGNGWAVGGPLLTGAVFTSIAVSDATVDDCMFDADDVNQTANGDTIGPAYKGLVYNSTTSKPLFLIDFGQAQSAGDTTPFKIRWPINGIFNFVVS
jgi:hypothetical protein